jgi:Ca2+-binding RTX toxin-like protein
VLSKAVFTALGTAGAPLSAAEFFAGAGATSGADASDRVIFNTTTRSLYYDADGSGAGASILFADVAGAAVLSAGSFLIEP